jgi:anti-sigma factor RsiW
MNCPHCQELLSPHLDNVLSTQERHEVSAHLEHCAECTERFQQLENARHLLRTLPSVEVTSAMTTRFWEKVQGQHSAPRAPHSAFFAWWHEWRFVSFGTLATAAVSFLFYFAMMQAPPKVSAEEVVESMDQLLSTIEPDDGEHLINEETPDEDDTPWQDDFGQGLFADEDEQN